MSNNSENLFEIIDVRGILIVCSKAQWEDHLTFNHPILKGKEENVKQAIKDPETIYQSDEYKNRDVYFGNMGNNKYMKVIVEISAPNYGEVVTAFPRKGKTGNIDTKVIKYDKS